MKRLRDLLSHPRTFQRFLLLAVAAVLFGMLWHALDQALWVDTGGRPLSDRQRKFDLTIPCRACDHMALWQWGYTYRCPHCDCEFEDKTKKK